MSWSTIAASLKSRDMQKRIAIVLLIVIAYRFLAQVPVPLAEPDKLKDVIDNVLSSNGFGGFLNLLTGGALASLSIVLVGLSPYITASIIVQMLTKVIPRLEEIHKDGEVGRRKLNQWTRIITLPLAIAQSISFIYIIRQSVLTGNTTAFANTTLWEWIMAVGAMTVGAMLLMWLGELITEQGIGNGMSLLIFGGIISQLPQMLSTVWASLTNTSDAEKNLHIFNWFTLPINADAFWVILALAIFGLVVLYYLVKINEAQRIIVINYAKRLTSNATYKGTRNIMPVKLITAGVIPVIFAISFLSLPLIIGQLLVASKSPQYAELGRNLVTWFQTPGSQQTATPIGATPESFIYPVIYFLLVVLFTYFYTSIAFNTSEISENLQKQGGFIEHVRPGSSTEKYLATMMRRLTLFGSLTLGLITILPFIIEFIFFKMSIQAGNLAIGGTGLLIVVSVALEALRHINSRALMITYDR